MSAVCVCARVVFRVFENVEVEVCENVCPKTQLERQVKQD